MIAIRKYFLFCFVVFSFGIFMVVYYLPTSPGQYFTNLNMHATKLLGYVANTEYHGVNEVDSGRYLQIMTQPFPGVLNGMMAGTWKTRELTSQEQAEVYDFYRDSRDVIPNSTNYQRLDLKCGILPYAKSGPKAWFRVLCNPDGSTPCCFHNRCENKTIDECRGPMNFDLRPRVHAEYSTWLPQNRRCSMKIFDSQSACKLLEGSTIYVIGDSLMRQLYTALLMVIRGDTKTGALKPNTPKAMRHICSGLYIFPHKFCRSYINFKPRVCNGSLKLEFKHYPSAKSGQRLAHDVMRLNGTTKSMVFVGIGTWDNYDYNRVVNMYLKPMLQALHGNSSYNGWPKVLWSAVHSLGIWRFPLVKTVDNFHIKQFNDKMAAYLRNYNISVYNTFNMTDGVMSIDGIHYGMGMNMLKAQMYLNYMQELKNKEMW